MVSEKSKANLKRGNPGKRKKITANKVDASNTHAAIYAAIGELPITEQERALFTLHGVTDAWLAARGITARKKFLADLMRWIESYGNPTMAREIMQREEPQNIGIAHSGKLTIEIIEDGAITFTTPTRGAIANTE